MLMFDSLRVSVMVVGWVLCVLLAWNLISCEETSIPLMLFVAFWAYLVYESTKREERKGRCR